ncbi:RTA1 like protein [Zopfia rhizophila CBS 207.26]|uniref:RTA1 like protein n=1 Tax=Zopfia rhizophila CBS 207.26 TaxID=1314779 RepID=A0A6A6DEX0_9PEZI|nr:RTA1 like protein [Zopfia rhizophila CBS 207.26]
MAEEHYDYSPSVPAAIIAIIVFAILLSIHLFRIFRARTWFCIPFVIGAIFEIIGYAARAVGHSNPTSTPAYIVQALLILLAPILLAASVYMFLGRIIRATGCESYSMIRPTQLTKVFVGGDILCFLIQALGAGMLAGSDGKKSSDRGKMIILFGLFLQIFIFGFFMLAGALFHVRIRRRPAGKRIACQWDWERYLRMLYGVSVMVTIRNLFRVVEYAMGENGYLMVKEWPIYVFDALLMAIVLAVCCMWHVGQIVPDAPRGSTEELEMMVGDEERQARRPG